MPSVTKVLIANRGECAVRVARTLRSMGVRAVAMRARDEGDVTHAKACDETAILPVDGLAAYLDAGAIVAAAKAAGADAIHPGWGFLSEQADFVRRAEAAGLTFIGPTAESMEALGDKGRAKDAARALGLPLVAAADDEAAARALPFPILLKPLAGGGGKGMVLVESADRLPAAWAQARREARAAFGDDRVMAEVYVHRPRHVEIQVLGDGRGGAWDLGERDCTLQRRHQKMIEESPSPFLDDAKRAEVAAHARSLVAHAKYRGVGTVEFMLDARGQLCFMEVNTRLQVEHGVTEERWGVDLVEIQVRLARGERVDLPAAPRTNHVIQSRVYAEDPYAGFLPATGAVLHLEDLNGGAVRVDAALSGGDEVNHLFDPMLAKIVATAATRGDAIEAARDALGNYVLLGVQTNLNYLRWALAHADFARGAHHTQWALERLDEYRAYEDALDLGGLSAVLAGSPAALAAGGDAEVAGPWSSFPAWRLGGGR